MSLRSDRLHAARREYEGARNLKIGQPLAVLPQAPMDI
jgi:hypothetical protein